MLRDILLQRIRIFAVLRSVRNSMLLRIYLMGYSGKTMPRIIRKALCRSEIHRAWLTGAKGFFTEGGVSYGPANPYDGGRLSMCLGGAAQS